MDQVSRPLLIALGAVVALLVVWLVALRPKPVSVSDTPLAPTQAVSKAKQAGAASDAANAKVQAATGSAAAAAPASKAPAAAAAPAPAPAAKPAAKPAAPAGETGRRLDGSVLRDMRAGKVVVVLFWNAKGADDVATRGAIRTLGGRHGKVAVHVVPITQVGRYPAVTQGITIAQSPTTLVIGRKRHTRTIVGLTEPSELKQAVDDALAGR